MTFLNVDSKSERKRHMEVNKHVQRVERREGVRTHSLTGLTKVSTTGLDEVRGNGCSINVSVLSGVTTILKGGVSLISLWLA